MQRAAALCGRYDYDAQDALVGLFAKQNGIPAECVHAYCGSRQPLQYAVAEFTGKERGLVIADPSYDSVVGAAQAQGRRSLPCRWTPRRPTTSSACSPPRNATPG